MKEKRRKYSPKAGPAAGSHGFYSKALTKSQAFQLAEARQIDGIDEEIAILRVKFFSVISGQPDRVDLHIAAADTITRMVKVRDKLSAGRKKALTDAVTRVLTEIAEPLGIRGTLQ